MIRKYIICTSENFVNLTYRGLNNFTESQMLKVQKITPKRTGSQLLECKEQL